jgi:nitrate reductase gamma subunit
MIEAFGFGVYVRIELGIGVCDSSRGGYGYMEIGSALFLIAVGAILRYAVTVKLTGFNIQLAGLILVIVGVIGLAIAIYRRLVRRPVRRGDLPRDDDLV